MKKLRLTATVISGAATAVISAVMNLYLLPRIRQEAGGLECFDLRFCYGYGDAQQFLSALSAEGRELYLTRQLPLDLLYPVAYGAFFILLFLAICKKKTPWVVLPACLVAADFCENALIFAMLRAAPQPSVAVAVFAGAATLIKTVLMYACFLALLVLVIRSLAARRKAKKTGKA